MVIELAVAGRCETIVTYNVRDFEGTARFGVKVSTPRQFMEQIGELK